MPIKIKIHLKFDNNIEDIQLVEDTGVGSVEGGVAEDDINLSQFSGIKRKKKKVKTSSKSKKYRSNMENN